MYVPFRLSPSDLLTPPYASETTPTTSDAVSDTISICHRDMDADQLSRFTLWRQRNACDMCEACAQLRHYRAYCVNQFLHERGTDPFGKWQSVEAMKRKGTYIHITVNARVIVSTHQSQWIRRFKDRHSVNEEENPIDHEVWCREVIGLCESIIGFTSQMSYPLDVVVVVSEA